MTQVARRDPDQVMRLSRLGSFHQSRLSFMRILTRRMVEEKWTFSTPVFDVDAQGVGHAVLCAHGPDRTYSLVAFAHDLPAEKRSDRVIAEAWDSTFTLFDGVPTDADIDRLRKNVPLQEAGRVTQTELSVSRANRSVRLWDHVVSQLARGEQPDQTAIDNVGYLMRTTAVYGSGKLGAADREMIAERPEFAAPFQVEMLSVYLTRVYVRDLVQHLANLRGGDKTAKLNPDLARRMGIGNSTGLGMAPFLINHPQLFNNWIMVREEAISRVRSLPLAKPQEVAIFRDLLARSVVSAAQWRSEHPIQIAKLAILRKDLHLLATHVAGFDFTGPNPWNDLFEWAQTGLGEDAQECLASLILEPYGEIVDGLSTCMSDNAEAGFRINGAMTIGALKSALSQSYSWAMDVDWAAKENCARLWYVSEEKLEPRLGERFAEPLAAFEQPLAPGRDAKALATALEPWNDTTSVTDFLSAHPEHRHCVRRVQTAETAPYAEIRDNTIGAELLPIDMLRCKLSFFGATHFDPRSDRWVRICLFGNAPYPEDLQNGTTDDWPYPPLSEGAL